MKDREGADRHGRPRKYLPHRIVHRPFHLRGHLHAHYDVHRWSQHQLRYRRSLHILLAFVIGMLGGALGIVFHYAIKLFTWLFTGYADYTEHIREPHGFLGLPWWFIMFLPCLSALIYGPILAGWGSQARGSGIPEVMLAVRRKGGRIKGSVAIIKILCASLTVGGGGSVGREGPVAQVGASVGSWLAQRFELPTQSIILMAGCGAGAGVSAMFNAPLAGAIFSLEAIVVSINSRTIGLIAVSSVTAAITSQLLIGDDVIYELPADLVLSAHSDMFWVAVVGLSAGFIGIAFQKTLFGTSDLVNQIYDGPLWAKPAVGGLLIGPLLMFLPQLYGLGTQVQLDVLNGDYGVIMLFVLLFGRILMTSLSIGWGASGGVFGPSLFMGACLGTLIGTLAQPYAHSSPAVFGVIGMGAVFAGAARVPLSAVLLIVEITGQFSLTMPMMLAVACAMLVSSLLSSKTIYTEKLARRSAVLDDPLYNTQIDDRRAGQLMVEPPAVLQADMTITEASIIIHANGGRSLPVVKSINDPSFVGSVSALMIAAARYAGTDPATTLSDTRLNYDYVTPQSPLWEIMERVEKAPTEGLPVLENNVIIGWISESDLARIMHRHYQRQLEDDENFQSLLRLLMFRWRNT